MYTQEIFPRWRGFNLLGMFTSKTSKYYNFRSPGYFCEEDFKMMADWGFDFARLPLSYRVWSSVDNPFEINEEKLAPLDEAIYFGKKYGIHINVCMHRLPGFCVNDDEQVEEKTLIWTDDEASDAAAYQWREIAKRYVNSPSGEVSFNVMNEPGKDLTSRQYRDVNKKIIDAVREITPDRMFIVEALQNLKPPVDAIRNFENCGYGMHFYEPTAVSHLGVGGRNEITPWPNDKKYDKWGDRTICNKDEMEKIVELWAAVSSILGVGVHCSEFGSVSNLPHDIACAWTEDLLDLLKKYNIGFAMWNLRGKFGIMDNGRTDIEMKDYCGHKLDEKMLKILQKY